jgi:hypothetical protein
MLAVRSLNNLGASIDSMRQRAWGLGEEAADKSRINTIKMKKGILRLGEFILFPPKCETTIYNDGPFTQAGYVGVNEETGICYL